MILAALPNARIQVLINQTTAVGNFSDAISFSQTEFAVLTAPQLTAMVAARIVNWVQSVTNPPAPLLPTLADILNDTGSALDKVTAMLTVLNAPPWVNIPALDERRAKLTALKAIIDAA